MKLTPERDGRPSAACSGQNPRLTTNYKIKEDQRGFKRIREDYSRLKQHWIRLNWFLKKIEKLSKGKLLKKCQVGLTFLPIFKKCTIFSYLPNEKP